MSAISDCANWSPQKPIQLEHAGFHSGTNGSGGGFIWNSSMIQTHTQMDEQEMQRSAAQVMDVSHHNLRDTIFIIQVIKA